MTYTREQILSMDGDELNHTAAEVVCGWSLESDDLGIIWWVDGAKRAQEYEYSPATDILDAWRLLENPVIMDKFQLGLYPTSFGKWICRSFMPGCPIFVQAETAPEAITKAAILSMMEVSEG